MRHANAAWTVCHVAIVIATVDRFSLIAAAAATTATVVSWRLDDDDDDDKQGLCNILHTRYISHTGQVHISTEVLDRACWV